MDTLRAFHLLSQEKNNCKLCFIGKVNDTSFYKTLTSFVDHFNLENKVIFIPQLKKPFKNFKHADPSINASHVESFGRIPLESMAHGIAVIASAGGGNLELIHDQDNSLSYTPCNIVDLKQKMKILIENPNLGSLLRRLLK